MEVRAVAALILDFDAAGLEVLRQRFGVRYAEREHLARRTPQPSAMAILAHRDSMNEKGVMKTKLSKKSPLRPSDQNHTGWFGVFLVLFGMFILLQVFSASGPLSDSRIGGRGGVMTGYEGLIAASLAIGAGAYGIWKSRRNGAEHGE